MTLLGIVLALLGIIALSVAAYKRRFTDVRNANQGVSVIDDFLNITANGATDVRSEYLNSATSGSGQVVVLRPVSPIYYPGAVALYTQATNDVALMATPPNYSLSGNQILDIQTRFYLDVLHTDALENAFGFTDQMFNRGSETTGAMIYFNPAVSNFWVCYVRNASGLTQQVTTVAANIAAADTYLRIIVTPNQSQFFVNAILVASIEQSPISTTPLAIGWTRHKTGGSASSEIVIDAVSILQNFADPRDFLNLPA